MAGPWLVVALAVGAAAAGEGERVDGSAAVPGAGEALAAPEDASLGVDDGEADEDEAGDEAGDVEAEEPEGDPADEAPATAGSAPPSAHPDVALASAPPGPRLSEGGRVVIDRRQRPDGTAVERLVESSGEVVVHEVNRAGTVLSCRTVGTLQLLRIVEQRAAAGGEVVHVVRDDSGALLRYVVGRDGEPRAVAVVAPVPR